MILKKGCQMSPNNEKTKQNFKNSHIQKFLIWNVKRIKKNHQNPLKTHGGDRKIMTSFGKSKLLRYKCRPPGPN